MSGLSKKMIQVLLSVAMLCTLLPYPNIQAVTTSKLVNIAKDCETTVPENEAAIPNMFDGDINTIWCPSTTAGWPARLMFKLPVENTRPVKKIKIDFKIENAAQEQWAIDLKLGYYVNSVTDELVAKEVKGQKLKDGFVFEFSEPTNISHAIVTMSNPTNGQEVVTFWPQIAEMEIYVEDQQTQENFENLASNAVVTCFDETAGNKANLTDGNLQSLYVFHNGGFSTIQGEAWIEVDLGKDKDVNALEIAFEKLASDPNNFEFTYSIYGMKNADSKWTKLVPSAKANRTNQAIQEYRLQLQGQSTLYRKFKIVMESITSTGGDPWPAIAEFKVLGKEAAVEDEGNIAWKKPTHTNTNQSASSKVTDGNVASSWNGAYYPGYVDIDLEENYNISTIEVYLPTNGYSQYDIYTSMNGRDFTKLVSKNDTKATLESGDCHNVNVEARIIRVYMNYQSSGSNAVIREVRVLGEKSNTPVQKTPEIVVENFADSKYNVQISEAMTIEEVKGIVTRQLGAQYVDWFEFALASNPKGNNYDFFTIKDGTNGKIRIEGNDGVSLATGLNHYLKYYLNVHISQVGNQVKMPSKAVSLKGKVVTKETKLQTRYAYNYCTLSYSMAFWGEKEWRNELDWLALNGVNAVLDATAQEEVWRRFLQEVGYSAQEAKDFISGPAYYAWSYMANMSGYGGPVHDSWFAQRSELARKNQFAMRKLGMQPILQGYSGMVPVDIESKDPSTKGSVIAQGSWCSFVRPSMLNATSQAFKDYAKIFYRVQKEVYGDVSDFYATDPYHEGGNPGGVSAQVVGQNVLKEMMGADANAIWIIQSWGGNPTPGLLQGVAANKEHVLILDLYAEKEPRWEGFNGTREFSDTPWIYCMLNNFGGRLGLHGHIENFVNSIPKAINETKYMRGIGITPEASVNNPVLYDLFFETIWADDADHMQAINLNTWFKDYTKRRYGAVSENAYQAMLILNETVYNPSLNMKGQGAPESVVNARPAMNISAASTWGNAVIDYDKAELEKAANLLLKDFDQLKTSEAYLYDVANVLEQILSNTAQEYQKAMVRAYHANDLAQFETISTKFLNLIDKVDQVTGTQATFLVGRWIEQAKALAANADEFTKELYEFNARSLITTWGSINQANAGGLHDYSNRQWSGLTKDYYKPRWELWIQERIKDLKGETGKNITNADWFAMEWQWVNDQKTYPTKTNGLNLKDLGTDILTNYTVASVPKDPAADETKDIDVNLLTPTVGSKQSVAEGENSLLDKDTGSIWHSEWAGTERKNLWVNLHLAKPMIVDGLRYLPRQDGGSNGIITGYVIEVSKDNGKTYQKVAEGTWANSMDWKLVNFAPQEDVSDVRLKATASITDASNNNYASCAELRVTTVQKEVVEADKTALQAAIKDAQAKVKDAHLYQDISKVQKALTAAKAVNANKEATQTQVDEAKVALENAVKALQLKTADYTKVDAAIAKANALTKANYVDFTKVDAAIKAVKRNLDITKQSEVDAYATAIETAIKELQLKAADYSKVDAAIQACEALDAKAYTPASWDELQKVIKAVKRNLDITKQKEVDAMAKAILDAKANLKEVEISKPEPQPEPQPEKPSTPLIPLEPSTPVEKPEQKPEVKPENKPNKDETGTGDVTNMLAMQTLVVVAGFSIMLLMIKKRKYTK